MYVGNGKFGHAKHEFQKSKNIQDVIIVKPLLSIKTLYRSPIKTFLTFLLLTVVTFALFSQTAEYAVTAREFNNAAKHYIGVGSVEIAPTEKPNPGSPTYINSDPRIAQLYPEEQKENYLDKLRYQPLTLEKIGAISALPYITSTDIRYMTAGISDTYYRLDDGSYFYNYSARCVIEGTLTEVQYGDPSAIGDVQHSFNQLILDDCKLLAGNPTWTVDHETLTVYADPSKYNEDDKAGIGEGYQRITSIHTHNYIYDTKYVKNMTSGSRYVFVLRFEPLSEQKKFYLSDHLTNTWCHAVWPIDGEPGNYLETEKFAPLQELSLITNADMHTFDMVYTDDMSAIIRFAEGNMAIHDGRALTKEDSANGSYVCVVSREFAEANELEVGDTITMNLGTELFEQYKGLGAVAATRERYKSAEEKVTFEIVGIYADTDGPNQQSKQPNWSYSINTVFVPKSLLPVDEALLTDHVFSPSEFSLKVENAWDIPAFLEETAPKIEEMGLENIFFDDGWPDIADAFQAARHLSLIKIAVLSAAIAAATGFVVYLFISRKKKEYAVMRALGTTRKVSARALILPLMVLAIISVLVGSCAAWIYTVKTVAHNNALSMLKEYSISTAIPAGAAIGCVLGEILLTLLFALVLLRRIGGLPPLALLQDNQTRGGKKGRKAPANIDAAVPEMKTPSIPLASVPSATKVLVEDTITYSIREVRKSRSTRFVLRYIWRHMRRSTGKSVLSVLLAALLLGVVGQLALMKQSYTELYANTVITANFVGGVPLDNVPSIIRSGYVTNPYYEVRKTVDLNFSNISIVFTNNIARYTGEETDITYADGFDASCMDEFGEVIIAGKGLMMKYGLEPGGTVKITREGFFDNLKKTYIARYRGDHPKDAVTDEEILVLYQNEITKSVNLMARTYMIAGVISTPSGEYDEIAFTPGTNEASLVVGATVKLDVAEVTLGDNFQADEFRSYAEKVSGGSSTSGVALIMDTSKLENLLNSLRLLEALYPVALAAALLIGGFLCCLVIFQSSKETAIMRIQGTTKRKTRAINALEQIFLSVAGLVIGACGLLLYKGSALAVVSGQLHLFAVLYFAVILIAAVICTTAATHRNVLELLQTKE